MRAIGGKTGIGINKTNQSTFGKSEVVVVIRGFLTIDPLHFQSGSRWIRRQYQPGETRMIFALFLVLFGFACGYGVTNG